MKIASGPKGQKRKWDKNPPIDKGTPLDKKLWDVTEVQRFNCKGLGHFAKNCDKIRQD